MALLNSDGQRERERENEGLSYLLNASMSPLDNNYRELVRCDNSGIRREITENGSDTKRGP